MPTTTPDPLHGSISDSAPVRLLGEDEVEELLEDEDEDEEDEEDEL